MQIAPALPQSSERPNEEALLTQALLKDVLSYDADTGIFTWVKSSRAGWVGKQAGTPFTVPSSKTSYLRVRILGKSYMLHRLAILYVSGTMPDNEVDHIDRNGLNNRISNLRTTSCKGNAQNRSLFLNSTSGVKGVSWNKKNSCWIAYVNCDGKRHYLGCFSSKDAAELVVKSKRSELHGEFTNHS